MDKIKEFYDKYKIYLTRQNLEILAVTVIALSAILVFTSNIPGKGVLTLDQGKIKYEGSLVHGKMNGEGTLTFKNGDSYKGYFKNGTFDGKGTFTSKAGWKYEGDTVVYRVEVPFDAEAEFRVEGMDLQKLGARTYVFEVKE